MFHPTDKKMLEMLKDFVVKITFLQKCKISLILTFVKRSCIDCTLLRSKFLAGKVSENSKNIWCKVKGQSQITYSCCCSPFKSYMYVWVQKLSFEWAIRILEIINWSLCLRLKLYGTLTLFWIEYSLFVSQSSKRVYIEFDKLFKVCRMKF